MGLDHALDRQWPGVKVLDLFPRALKAWSMAGDVLRQRPSRPLLTLGRVDLVRVQVGYRTRPEGPVSQHFLIDLPVSEADNAHDPVDESRILDALEPVLYAGAAAPRHYSLHVHRWHTSWGASPGALEVGLLVTTGSRTAAVSDVWQDGVVRAFRALLSMAGQSDATPMTRDAAIMRAQHSAATAYALNPESLSLSAEEHHAAENSWTVGLRTATADEYDVVVGLVDGYAKSVRVRHGERTEVFDSVGSE